MKNGAVSLAMCWIAVSFVCTADAAPSAAPQTERCGWLIESEGELIPQPDPLLKPGGSTPLPNPPASAKAAYCDRESIIPGDNDWRVILLGVPLVIRSGGRQLVFDYPPNVVFEYHVDNGRYLPGATQSESVTAH